MLQITKPEVSLKEALTERALALSVRAKECDLLDPWGYVFYKAAQFTYERAAAECEDESPLTLAERTAAATAYLTTEQFVWSYGDPNAAESGREFALSIIRGLELR